MRGSKEYVILGFRVPTTSVGARGEVVRGSEGCSGAREAQGVMGQGETRGEGSKGNKAPESD